MRVMVAVWLFILLLQPSQAQQIDTPDLVRAVDRLSQSPAWQRFNDLVVEQNREPTLEVKRAVMNEPAASQALWLVRERVKDSSSPLIGRLIKLNTPKSDFPRDFQSFRALGRLLSCRIYVDLADGRTESAVNWVQCGLRYGYLLQAENVFNAQVGRLVQLTVLGTLSPRLDQLSEPDCRRLLSFIQKWGSGSGSADRIIRDEYRNAVQQLRNPGPELSQFIPTGSAGEKVLSGAMELLNSHHHHLEEQLRLPASRRLPWQPKSADPSSLKVLGQIYMDQVLDLMILDLTRDRSQIQIVGVRTAINLFRWQHAALPTSLEVLKLGELVVDPLNGEIFRYRTIDKFKYEVVSSSDEARL